LQGEAADETETPALLETQALKLVGRSDDLKHGRPLS
jgi:hypothetical protein